MFLRCAGVCRERAILNCARIAFPAILIDANQLNTRHSYADSMFYASFDSIIPKRSKNHNSATVCARSLGIGIGVRVLLATLFAGQ